MAMPKIFTKGQEIEYPALIFNIRTLPNHAGTHCYKETTPTVTFHKRFDISDEPKDKSSLNIDNGPITEAQEHTSQKTNSGEVFEKYQRIFTENFSSSNLKRFDGKALKRKAFISPESTNVRSMKVDSNEAVKLDVSSHCGICKKTFGNIGNLRKHKLIHQREKQYKCSQCTKAFRYSKYLRKHEKTHAGMKEFICITCNKGFTTSGNLKTHSKIHTRLLK